MSIESRLTLRPNGCNPFFAAAILFCYLSVPVLFLCVRLPAQEDPLAAPYIILVHVYALYIVTLSDLVLFMSRVMRLSDYKHVICRSQLTMPSPISYFLSQQALSDVVVDMTTR